LHQTGPYLKDYQGWHWIPDGANPSGRSIVISPQPDYASTLYYGVWRFDLDPVGSVFKTTNSGKTWKDVSQDMGELKVYSMAIDPYDSANTLYMATFTRGVLKTTDGSETWQLAGMQTDPLYSIAINPSMTNNLFTGTAGDGLYRSIDFAASWQRSDTGINNAMVTSVVHHPTNPYLVYSSVYGAGVYHSSNRGLAWEAMNLGLTDKFVHDLVMDPVNLNLLYALTDTGGLYQYDLNSGQGWIPVSQGLAINQTQIPAFPANHPFATLDMMENFANPQDSLANIQAFGASLLTMVYAPSNPSRAYMGTSGSGVYRTTDSAAHWDFANLGGHDVYSLAVDRTNPNVVYAATNITDTLEISTDGGNSWQEAYLSKSGNPPVFFYSVAASPFEDGVLYAGTNIGIYHYQGNNFTSLGLLNQTVTAISLDPTRPGIIYAGTSSGAYYSTNNGQTWNIVDNQLNGQTILSITVDKIDPHLVFFSTKTHGVYLANIR
jgi:photosystem II stability/assembly factor-like uncharacterized protein